MTVGMGHKRPGEAEDARIAGKGAVRQFGQQAIVPVRQIRLDLADLCRDHMIIVDQPFGSRGDETTLVESCRNRLMRLKQDGGIGLQAANERGHATRFDRDGLGGCQRFRVLLQPIDAEKLLADG